MDYILEHIEIFFLCFARISAFIVLLPVLGSKTVPSQVKVAVSLLLAVFMMPAVHGSIDAAAQGAIPFFILVAKEVLVGITLGFVTKFLFAGIQLGGEIIGVQMGFGVAKVVDPGYRSQMSIISEFQTVVATLIYLTISGHHFLLQGLSLTYSAIPVGAPLQQNSMAGQISAMASGMFISAVKIGAPVIAALLLSNVALGIVARTVPQMNIFIVGLPLKIAIGFIGLMVTATLFGHVFKYLWAAFEHHFVALIELL